MKTRSILVAAALLGLGIISLPKPAVAAAPLTPVVLAPDDATRAKVAELCRSAIEKRKAGDLDGALAACNAALFLEKKSPDVYAEMAEIAAARGNVNEALKDYRIAIGAEPGQTWGESRMDDGDLHLRYSLYLFKNGSFADALAMYKEALDRMPDEEKKMVPSKFDAKGLPTNTAEQQKLETAARTALGLRLLALGMSDDAAVQFENVLKVTPSCAAAQYGLGTVHLAKGRKGEALIALQKAAGGQDDTVRDMAKKAIGDNH